MHNFLTSPKHQLLDVAPTNCELEKDDPEFFATVSEYWKFLQSFNIDASSSWYRSGVPITPQMGGQWIKSTSPMTPIKSLPSNSIITKINYNYSNSFGAWTKQTSVGLYVIDTSQTKFWDITSSTSASLNLSGFNMKANCQIYYALKVGNAAVKLYNPPTLSICDVDVYYQY